jgi:hypothetical protein
VVEPSPAVAAACERDEEREGGDKVEGLVPECWRPVERGMGTNTSLSALTPSEPPERTLVDAGALCTYTLATKQALGHRSHLSPIVQWSEGRLVSSQVLVCTASH